LSLAEQSAQRAIELEPDSPRIHLALGYTYLWAYRDADKALAELALAEKMLGDNAEVSTAKAYVFELQGRWVEALNAFDKAIEGSLYDASHLTEIAIAYWVTRQYAQGEEAADEAIALAPGAAWPYITKAFIHWSWKGVTKEARAALASVPVDHSWAPWCLYWQELQSGRYREALGVLSSTSNDWIRLKMWARPDSMLEAFVHELLGEPNLARQAYESARAQLESEIQSSPDDPRYHSSLGIVYAALGRNDEAIREGKCAVELLPISKDAFYGLPYVQDLAHIYTLVGDHDAALDELEYLLSIPSYFSPTWIENDPRWNPLRKHPRYLKILEN
jgi:tetratricopeptide (TPR) repeat protein